MILATASLSSLALFLGTTHATITPSTMHLKSLGYSGGLRNFFQKNAKDINVTEHVIESYSENSHHLRALDMPDNFIGVTYYMDDQCTQPVQQVALLLNYCVNQISEDGVKRSILGKLNKKQHTYVELMYDGKNCQGIPSKVVDIVKSFTPDFTMDKDYGQCYFDSFSGRYSTVDYHTTYPMPHPGGYVMTLSPESDCSTDNSGYYQYYWTKNIPFSIPGCNMLDASVYGYFHECSGGQVLIDAYMGTSCSGPVYGTFPLFETCAPHNDDDDGDDDDDGGFFDDYTFVDAYESSFCI